VARRLPPPSSDLDDDKIVPDSELEFEDLEDAIQNESSGDSGDDFVPGESSESDALQDRGSDVPLRVSMATPSTSTRPSSSKAGSSSKTWGGRGSAAKTQYEVESSDPSDSDDSTVASKKAPRRKQAAPAKSKRRRGVVPLRRPPGPRRGRWRRAESEASGQESDISDGLLEPSDDDTKPPPNGLHPNQTRTVIKVAERRMRKKLGRKLTMVWHSTAYPRLPYVDDCSFAFSVKSRRSNSTSSIQNSRVVGEISRRPLLSSPRRRRSNPRICGPFFCRSSRKACTG